MSRLPTEARPTDIMRLTLRPRRSAMRPKSRPPRGRARNPTAKTARVESSADVGSALENMCDAMNAVSVE